MIENNLFEISLEKIINSLPFSILLQHILGQVPYSAKKIFCLQVNEKHITFIVRKQRSCIGFLLNLNSKDHRQINKGLILRRGK